MKARIRNGSPVMILTPDELKLYRKAIFNRTEFTQQDIDEAKWTKIVNIATKYGSIYFDHVMLTVEKITGKTLVEDYNFSLGFSFFPIESIHYPHWIFDTEYIKTYFQYVAEILSILGWNVCVEQKTKNLTLSFAPLRPFSPSEVDEIRTTKVNQFAGRTFQKINNLVYDESQFVFNPKEIELDNIPPRLYLDVIDRVRELLGPLWIFSDNSNTYSLRRNTPT